MSKWTLFFARKYHEVEWIQKQQYDSQALQTLSVRKDKDQ